MSLDCLWDLELLSGYEAVITNFFSLADDAIFIESVGYQFVGPLVKGEPIAYPK